MANEFKIKNGLLVDAGGAQVTGSLNAPSITGSLQGTSSYAITASYILQAVSASYANVFPYTGSAIISGSLTITGSLSITGSTIKTGNNTLIGTNTLSGSNLISGSTIQTGNNTLIGTNSLTGSNYMSGSNFQVGNNTLLGNTTLSGSIIISGSYPVGSYSSSVNIYGDTSMTGYLKFNPQSTNIDTTISASYIFVSGSTNDLYFSQNTNGYDNTTRLRWIEGSLYTGVLSGGVLSSTVGSNTFSISSGSGVIVALNAFTASSDPFPTIKYVKWNGVVNTPLIFSGSAKITYVGMDNTGTPIQQTVPWGTNDINQWDTAIELGLVLHLSGSVSSGVYNSPQLAYGFTQRADDFLRAFGPLKISGNTLQTSGSTLGLTKAAGTAWNDGANYIVNPNHPSLIADPAITVSKIYRYYVSGSTPVIDTNGGGAGYTVIDPTLYNDNGVLTSVPSARYSIQRVFWIPNSPTNAFIVYYGNAKYTSAANAQAAIATEAFTEAPNTSANAILLGYIIVLGNETNLQNASIIQGGLFRSIGGIGASNASGISSTLAGLSDVALTSLSTGDLLIYNAAGGTQWNNTKTLNGSYVLSGSLTVASGSTLVGTASYATTAQTASYVVTAQTASYVLQAVSASYASTASYVVTAQTASYVTTAQTASYITTAQTASYILNAVTASYVTTAQTASYILQAVSASFATTASYVLGGASNITIQDEGSPQGAAGTINFVGAGVTATVAAGTATITIPGGAGSTFPYTGSAIISGSLIVTGSINGNLTGSVLGTASYAQTASYVVSSSYATTASYVLNAVTTPTFPYTGSAIISGSLIITGSESISGSLIVSNVITASALLLTSSRALALQNRIIFDSMSATPTDGFGLYIQNTTAATASLPQYSPVLSLEGQGWTTTVTQSQALKFQAYVVPTQNTTTVGGYLVLQPFSSGSAASDQVRIYHGGTIGYGLASLGQINASTFGAVGSNYYRDTIAGLVRKTTNFVSLLDFQNGGFQFKTAPSSTSGSVITLTTLGTLTNSGSVQFTQLGHSGSAAVPTIRLDAGSHVSMSTATEFPDFVFGGLSTDAVSSPSTRTAAWAAGTVPIQRFNYIRGTIVSGTLAIATFTNLYTTYIDSSSVGTNASVVNNWALGVNGNVQIIGNETITGSSIATGGYTGSLFGTASIAVSASYATTAQTASFVTTAQTASYVTTAQTASYVLQAISSSYASTASIAVSSSFATTASYVLGGSSTIVIQDEGSPQGSAGTINFVGSGVTATVGGGTATITIPGGAGSTFPYTGSAIISGSLIVTGSIYGSLTGSVLGTSSYAVTSSYATTASLAVSSSYATTASYVLNAPTSTTFPYTGSAIISGSLIVTGSTFYSGSLTVGGGGTIFATPTSASAGLNIGTQTVTPTTLNNGDLYYNGSTGIVAKWGATVYGLLGSTAGFGAANQVPFAANAFGLQSNTQFTFAATTNTGIGTTLGMSMTQGALASNWVPALKITPGAHTGITSNTEFITNVFSGSTQTFNSGSVAIQRSNYFKGFTLAGSGSVATSASFANAYTVFIDAPSAGASASIANAWALGVSGSVFVTGSVIISGSTSNVGSSSFVVLNSSQPAFDVKDNNDVYFKNIAGNESFRITGQTSGQNRMLVGATTSNYWGAANVNGAQTATAAQVHGFAWHAIGTIAAGGTGGLFNFISATGFGVAATGTHRILAVNNNITYGNTGAQTANYIGLDLAPTVNITAPTSVVTITGIDYNPVMTSFASTTGIHNAALFRVGNVGIGTATPSASLHISGNLLITGAITGSIISASQFTGSLFGTASYASVATVSVTPLTVTGSSIYSTNPATSGMTATNGVFMGFQAGLNATAADNSNFVGYQAGSSATGAYRANFYGYQAGQGASNAYQSNFFGYGAGLSATNAYSSNFFGFAAGYTATSAANSNFFGDHAGNGVTNASDSNFFGYAAGEQAINAIYSNFFGRQAGNTAPWAIQSNFFGYQAGFSATSASNSNFFGYQAGSNAASASYSNLFGYQVGYNATQLGSNNIIIGTNITLPAFYANGINIGGILFGSGTYSTTGGSPVSTPVSNGKIGINQATPIYNLDVSGSGNFTNGLTVTGSILGTIASASYSTTASYALTAQTLLGSVVSASYAATASYVLGGSSTIAIQDEGSPQGSVGTINFTGAGVTATVAAGTATVNIPGGAGSTFPYTGSAIISGSLIVTGSINGNLTGSVLGTSSWSNNAVTASYVTTAQTASYVTTAQTASYVSQSVSASFATTASYAFTQFNQKAGSVASASFGGSPRTASVTFGTAFKDTNYAVTVTGETNRTWMIQSKATTGFVINANSSVGVTGNTYWIAMAYGETI